MAVITSLITATAVVRPASGVNELSAARRVYQRAGFQLDEEHVVPWHGAKANEQLWSMDLT